MGKTEKRRTGLRTNRASETTKSSTRLPPLTPNHPTPSRYYGYHVPGYTGHVQSGQFRFGKSYSYISRDVMAVSPSGHNAAALFAE